MSCHDIPGRHLAFTRLLYLSVMSANPDDARPSRSPVSRRQVLAVGGTGLLAATANATKAAARTRKARAAGGDGTPEQIHLTWGENPAASVVVSWASPEPATRPRVRIGQRVIKAEPRQYTDGINGETVWTYHARVDGLRPGATYAYAVTADNDSDAADPFTATFQTAPHGRAAFRFTLDLATPNTASLLSYGQSAYAVDTVESFQPLFHLLNGDLCYADLNPTVQPEVWRDFGNNNQTSAANRPWMPCLGNHEVEFDNGAQGFTSYLTRYTLPDNHVPGFGGRWYSFRIGSVLFVSLDADATWSAKRDTSTGYGIAVFDVQPDPEDFGGHTSITVTQYHEVGADPVNPATGAKGAPTPDYTEFETFTLIRPRRG
jgi:hypothetical protein